MTVVKRRSLADAIVDSIKQDIKRGAYPEGSRLPTEAAIGKSFEVSRATVRSAMKELKVLGLVQTQHGVGTFARKHSTVTDGLERMGSITDSIRASGKQPGHDYARRTIRAVLPDEAERMNVPADTEVLELRRRITADGEVVAYSYDIIPRSLFPSTFIVSELTGSMFHYFETRLGLHPTLGIAQVHAVSSAHIAWGDDATRHQLFILLDQMHYTLDHLLLAYSRTYFAEGAYEFIVIRRSE